MSEHKDPAEVVEAAAEAVEALAENDNSRKTPSVGPFSDHKLRSLAALILSCASLIATLGTFIKTCDHSVTQNAYNELSTNITQLSNDAKQNHDDLVALRGYLDGLAHAPLITTGAPVPTASASAVAPPAVIPALRPLVRPAPSASAASYVAPLPPNVAALVVSDTVPVPTIHPAPPPAAPRPFADVAAGK